MTCKTKKAEGEGGVLRKMTVYQGAAMDSYLREFVRQHFLNGESCNEDSDCSSDRCSRRHWNTLWDLIYMSG